MSVCRILYIIVLVAFFSHASWSQSPHWTGVLRAGGNYSDEATSICADNSGNVIVAGTFKSPTITLGAITLTNQISSLCSPASCFEIFVAKYSATGTCLWANKVSGYLQEGNAVVSTDSLGNVYMAGIFSSDSITIGNTICRNKGNYDFFVVKYDPSGTVLWVRCEGSSGYEEVSDIEVDKQGNVYVLGNFGHNITIDTFSMICRGNFDFFIVKYDSAGNVLKVSDFGGSGNDVAHGIDVDKSNNVIVTGQFGSSRLILGNDTLTTLLGDNLFVFKMAQTGQVRWSTNYSLGNSEAGVDVVCDSSNNIFVAGTQIPVNRQRPMLLKYDSSGTFLNMSWSTGNMWDYTSGVDIDEKQNVYLVGNFRSDSLTFGNKTVYNKVSGTYDAFIMCFDNSLGELWGTQLGEQSDDRITKSGVAFDTAGNLLVAGFFESDSLVLGNNKVVNASLAYDMFLAKMEINCFNFPSPPLSIQGNLVVCPFMQETYHASPITGATNYIWSLPPGWTGSSNVDSIIVTPGYQWGNVKVKGSNLCGTGPSQSIFVSVRPAPSNNIIKVADTLYGLPGYSGYQWYRNGVAISGAVLYWHIPDSNGNYTLEVTNNDGCTSISNAINIVITKATDTKIALSKVYPTVNEGIFFIELNRSSSFLISDVQGRVIKRGFIISGVNTVNISDQPNGIYFIKVEKEEYQQRLKIVISR